MKKKRIWIGAIILALLLFMVLSVTAGLQEALSQQIQAVDLTKVADGTYTGDYSNGRFSNTVNVVVSNHAITAIEPVKIPNGRDQLTRDLTDRVIAAQQPNVDAIAGATASSKSFLKAVETALDSAGTP